MSTTSLPLWPLWVWQTLTGVLAVGGIFLLVWGIRGDRSKGRKRCPKCWYDMSATTGLVCSECGHDAAREKRLFKARRRPWAVVIGLVAMLGSYGTHIGPRVQARGWIAAVPFRLLVLYTESSPPLGGLLVNGRRFNNVVRAQNEFCCRIRDNNIWQWDKRWAFARFAKTVDFDYAIIVRPTLMPGQPLWVVISLPDGLMRPLSAQIILKPRKGFSSDSLTTIIERPTSAASWSGPSETLVELAPVADGATSLEFDVLFCDDDGGELHSQHIHRPMKFAASVGEMLEPDSSERLAFNIQKLFQVDWSGTVGRRPGLHCTSPYFARGDATIGMTVELCRDGEVWSSMSLLIPAQHSRNYLLDNTLDRIYQGRAPDSDDLCSGRWTLRVRGDPLVAYRDPLATKYWKGEFTIPIVPPAQNPGEAPVAPTSTPE